MTLSKLKKSEQILIAAVMVVLLLGGYAALRFVPYNNAIMTLKAQSQATERKLLTTRVPDEPQQGVKELLEQLDDQEQALALIREMAETVSQRLAPFDSQELKVQVSELARNSGVRILTNEAYTSVLPRPATPQQATNKRSKKANKKTANTPVAVPATDIILPSSYSWIERMSARTAFNRPMQRLVLEGDYQSLRTFIQGLATLNWQVTVVRLKLEMMPAAPLRGYAQRLSSELVLAL